MTLVNCRNCGKLTLNRFDGYCPDCSDEREALIARIKDFLLSNREAGISDIVKHTDIPSRLVLEFVQEGRISCAAAEKPRLA